MNEYRLSQTTIPTITWPITITDVALHFCWATILCRYGLDTLISGKFASVSRQSTSSYVITAQFSLILFSLIITPFFYCLISTHSFHDIDTILEFTGPPQCHVLGLHLAFWKTGAGNFFAVFKKLIFPEKMNEINSCLPRGSWASSVTLPFCNI